MKIYAERDDVTSEVMEVGRIIFRSTVGRTHMCTCTHDSKNNIITSLMSPARTLPRQLHLSDKKMHDVLLMKEIIVARFFSVFV